MNRKRDILAKNILLIFLDKLMEFPLWVKQIIYLRLHKDLATSLSEDFIQTKEEDVFHMHVPKLSYLGRTELEEKKGGYDANIYNFIKNVSENLSILEISMNNFWTMEEVAKYYILCLEQDFIKTPESNQMHAMAAFMAGKFRTGEYFKHAGKINIQQLEQVITKQKELADKGTPMKMAEVMISLGFITEKDTSSLLIMKEEAKRRFILDSSIIPKEAQVAPMDATAYQDKINDLTEQNKKLKDQLSRILAFMKKNG